MGSARRSDRGAGGADGPGRRLVHRDELGAAGPGPEQAGQAGRHRAGRFQLDAQLGEFRAHVGQVLLVPPQLAFQLEDALDAREVDPLFLGQALDLAEREHVAQRVPAAPAAGAARGHQPQPVLVRRVCGCRPASWAATEMTYTGESSDRSNALLMASPALLARGTPPQPRHPPPRDAPPARPASPADQFHVLDAMSDAPGALQQVIARVLPGGGLPEVLQGLPGLAVHVLRHLDLRR